ncbi:phospholipase [Microbacterium sp. ZW T5_45]|uniref:aggregation-promoting factor C-terminal-like domain-containing protein n=1 Tax=Microbacterium sp. ZW T5_45 TaxID=3378080 RepID=UPI003854AD43
MIHHTRALRRASEAASARAAVTARRPKIIFGASAAALLGITLTVGVISTPAIGDETADPITAVAQLVSGDAGEERFADPAVIPLSEAETAITAAGDLSSTVLDSGLDVGDVAVAIDTTELQDEVEALRTRSELSSIALVIRTASLRENTQDVVTETAALQTAFTAAQEKKAADDAAQAAAEQAAAEAAAQAAALAAANTPDGARATAQQMAASEYGWGSDQFSCLNSLWNKESGWNYQAYNPSGATGIPQALPGSKMASAGSDWETNATTQIAWGLGYISSVYGTPCSAWSHSQAMNWY